MILRTGTCEIVHHEQQNKRVLRFQSVSSVSSYILKDGPNNCMGAGNGFVVPQVADPDGPLCDPLTSATVHFRKEVVQQSSGCSDRKTHSNPFLSRLTC